MEEDSLNGKFVYIDYIDSVTGIKMVHGGKLEKIIFDKDYRYKIKLNPIFKFGDHNKYVKTKCNSIKVISRENYLGMEEETEKNMQKFYKKINAQILKSKKKSNENSTYVEEVYAKEGNTRNNFYSHPPTMGFK